MFELLSEKIGNIFKKLSGKGKLSEKDVDEALRQVRLALLEADVNLKVVKEFTQKVKERSLTSQVLESLTPAQHVVKIVHEELIAILGGKQSWLVPAGHPPSIVMLVGLQGSGKTTTAAKLALHLRRSGQKPLLVAADTRRPAAIEQVVILGKQLDIPVYAEDPKAAPATICTHAIKRAEELAANWLVVDTQGRLHIDEALMKELVEVKKVLQPSEVLLVVDAMTGQEAVHIAEEFNASVALTGLILTKMDGDARGGAALSIKSVTGVPIKFIGTGEKVDAFEPFYPDRLASRILGMGDMLTLIERAEKVFDEQQAREMEKKIRTATFNLDDFLEQLQQVKKMGPLSQLIEMVPGLSSLTHRIPQGVDEKQLKKVEAIIFSMTPEERRHPNIIDGSRRKRIARGSGTTPQDINQLLNQFRQAQKLMRQLDSGKARQLLSMLK
ncbi:MAG TPA: signal recognition particle protein [Dehalococcoidia bacterium]|nr:signal recognition particle protein [Dehalococcoidia bacterium]